MQETSSNTISQATALLIAKGFTREWAEEVLRSESYSAHPQNAEEWVNQILRREAENGDGTGRQQILDEHHRAGIPPYEPPTRE